MTFAITEVGDSALCPNVAGSACTQVFRINIVISGNCQITGNYGINWNLDCQLDPNNGARPASCAINAGATSSAAISILSEDFCAKVSVKIQITGSLASYDSATYLNPKTQFIVNQTTYFRANVNSPTRPSSRPLSALSSSSLALTLRSSSTLTARRPSLMPTSTSTSLVLTSLSSTSPSRSPTSRASSRTRPRPTPSLLALTSPSLVFPA